MQRVLLRRSLEFKQVLLVQRNTLLVHNRKQRNRQDTGARVLPYIELLIGSYFVYMVDFAIETLNFLAVPFLLLFVCGYFWAGISTLYEEYRDKLQWQRARKLAEV